MSALVPLVGALIGFCVAIVFVLCHFGLGLALWPSLLIAFASELLLTGALHEDGLADMADALGARDRDRRLAIMRDSRIGSYGALALILAVVARLTLMESLLEHRGTGHALMLFIALAALSRGAMLVVPATLPPARKEGLGLGAGRPGGAQMAWVLALCAGLALVGLVVAPGLAWVKALAVAFIAAFGLSIFFGRAFGGYTGDLIGAAQQVSLIAMLLALG